MTGGQKSEEKKQKRFGKLNAPSAMSICTFAKCVLNDSQKNGMFVVDLGFINLGPVRFYMQNIWRNRLPYIFLQRVIISVTLVE